MTNKFGRFIVLCYTQATLVSMLNKTFWSLTSLGLLDHRFGAEGVDVVLEEFENSGGSSLQ